MSGESPATTLADAPPQLLFVGDDLRASGLALGKIEHDLMQVQEQLADPGVGKQELEQLLGAIDFDSQIDRLDQALAGLRGAIARLRDRERETAQNVP